MILDAQRKRAAGTDGGSWKDATLEELKAFFGLNIAIGIVKFSGAQMYWQKKMVDHPLPKLSSLCLEIGFTFFYGGLSNTHHLTPADIAKVGPCQVVKHLEKRNHVHSSHIELA